MEAEYSNVVQVQSANATFVQESVEQLACRPDKHILCSCVIGPIYPGMSGTLPSIHIKSVNWPPDWADGRAYLGSKFKLFQSIHVIDPVQCACLAFWRLINSYNCSCSRT